MQKLASAPKSTADAVTRRTHRVAHTRLGDRAARVGLPARGLVFVLLGYLVACVAAGALGTGGLRQPASMPGVADARFRYA